MTLLLIALAALGIVAAILGLLSRHDEPIQTGTDCQTCQGDNEKCEMECRLEAAVKEVEYYNDEELDTYKGRRSDSYSDSETEAFAEVLYTMQPGEVKGWARSLSLRGIEVPDQLKDELYMLMSDPGK